MQKQIEIQSNKTKILLYLLGAGIFVVLGVQFVLDPDKFAKTSYIDSTIVFIVGVASILFFGMGLYIFLRRLLENRPALIINDTGIVFNTHSPAEGNVAWSDIENIFLADVSYGFGTKKFIMIAVKNPDEFIATQKSAMKRNVMKLNMQYGGPISITGQGIKISIPELFSMLTKAQMEKGN